MTVTAMTISAIVIAQRALRGHSGVMRPHQTVSPGPRRDGAELRLHVARDVGDVVIVVTGDLEHRTAEYLSGLVVRTVAGGGVATLTIAAAAVGFTDSSGLTALLHARATCADAAVAFRLRHAGRQLRDLLARTSLDGVLLAA